MKSIGSTHESVQNYKGAHELLSMERKVKLERKKEKNKGACSGSMNMALYKSLQIKKTVIVIVS